VAGVAVPASLPHLSLLYSTSTVTATAKYPAPLPSLGLIMSASADYPSVRNPSPLPSLNSLFGTSSAYVLTAAQGVYTYTGGPVLADYEMAVAQGSYSLSGQAISFRRAYTIFPATGSYGLNGQAVNLVRGIKLSITQGSYSISGQSVVLTKSASRVLPVTTGTFSLSGQSVTLKRSVSLRVETGSYLLRPFDTGLNYTERVKEYVPYLIGSLQPLAEAQIRAIYCIPNVTGSGGTVVSQSPPHMTQVLRGSTISITMGGAVNYTKLHRRGGLPPYGYPS